MTVARYHALEQREDRKALGNFIVQRFEERYLRPVDESQSKHGFTILAVCCLVIENLESFYQGRADTRRRSKDMFRDFFNRETSLRVFGGDNNWFYRDIRCGILHQGEIRGGWRVWRRGPLLDTKAKTINASQFLSELRNAVRTYSTQIVSNEECWNQFKKKMKAVCTNCE